MSNHEKWSFNLPNKNFLNGFVKGNGKSTVFDLNGKYGVAYSTSTNTHLYLTSNAVGLNTGAKVSVGGAPAETVVATGITTDPTKSGIICDKDLNIKYIIKY